MKKFDEFGLSGPILQSLADAGHENPTPIQSGAIPASLGGADILGIAQTGSGKTAAFALPILHNLTHEKTGRRRGDPCRALVLTPTRELAAQVLDRFRVYGKRLNLRTVLVIGGASIGKQKTAVRNGVDIVVATPGRLADLMKQDAIDLSAVEILVLDEVDQMLDLGFIHSIRAITGALPKERQSVFFSATMPRPIAKLAAALLRDPVRVEIEAEKRPDIDQSVMFMEQPGKHHALIDIVKREDFARGLVFTRTKRGADRVTKALNSNGMKAFAIHGNRSQSQRERALDAFRKGKAPILVATDIAARGIDIKGVTHVVNYDLPNVPETYVHRIGRTARAGAAGVAVSFCTGEERAYLRAIERLTGRRITAVGKDGGKDDAGRDEDARSGAAEPRNQRRRHRGRKSAAPGGKKPAGPRKYAKASGEASQAGEQKGENRGKRRTAGVRRRRNRGAAGRELSGHAG